MSPQQPHPGGSISSAEGITGTNGTNGAYKASLAPSSRPLSTIPPVPKPLGRFIIASPYHDDAHQLDLQTLDMENQLLARALAHMEHVREDYATAVYTESFNWDEVMSEVRRLAEEGGHQWRESSFYIVAFRSQIPPTTVYADLGVLDKAAHREAVQSGALLKYAFLSTREYSDLACADSPQVLVWISRHQRPESRDLLVEVHRRRTTRGHRSCPPQSGQCDKDAVQGVEDRPPSPHCPGRPPKLGDCRLDRVDE